MSESELNIEVREFKSPWWSFALGDSYCHDGEMYVVTQIRVSSAGGSCVVVVLYMRSRPGGSLTGYKRSFVASGPHAYELLPGTGSEEDSGL